MTIKNNTTNQLSTNIQTFKSLFTNYKNRNASIPSLDDRKIMPPIQNHYCELEIFKRQLTNEYRDYSSHCHTIFRYRLIFFALGLLFLALGLFTFAHNLTFSSVLMDHLRILARNSLAIFAVVLAVSSAAIGYSLCAMKEATYTLTFKSKRQATQLYTSKRLKHGVANLLTAEWDSGRRTALKHAYREVLMKIDAKREETLTLLRKIQKADNLNAKERELLINQSLAELDDTLRVILYRYKTSS